MTRGFSNLEYESSENTIGGSGQNASFLKRKLVGIVFLSLAIGLAVGILIGHFAIEKKSDDTVNDGTTGAIVGSDQTTTTGGSVEATTTIMTSSATSTTAPDITTSSCISPTTEPVENTDGVFLPNVSEAIIRDENPNVTEWILAEMNATNISENLKLLVESPHVAGTDKDFEQANDLKKFWLREGLDVAVTTPYDILLSYPDSVIPNKVRVLNTSSSDGEEHEILASPDNEANLTPDEWSDDFPFPYLGYSGNGTVRGSIVYVNYARTVDFETLDELNISVSGHIVLARYGRGGRSGKVRRSELRGAVGVIMYSDPADYIAPWAKDYYSESFWIPPTATSRGSIFMGTGDPLTPGYPAIASAFRYGENDTESNLPHIPAMPIGYDIAEQLLRLIGGPDAPEGWTGRLFNEHETYKIGPGFTQDNVTAELSVHATNQRRTSYNAFGMIKGEVEPDRYVMLGNHRDSWVLGAIDPSSGTATMMELSRVLGNMVKENRWRPRRSIIFCSWGAEEFGLIGSTEWIEENKLLDSRSVAYINMDIAVTGNYSIRGLGSPPLFTAMYEAAKKVPNPNQNESAMLSTVYDTWMDKKPLKDPESGNSLDLPEITSPGAGSDYGTFQMRAGISCADFRYDQDFTGDGVLFYPLYHTSYETFYAVSELIDPGFTLHKTIGMMSGELLRDLADSKLLPFNMADYTVFLEHYSYWLLNNSQELLKNNDINITQLSEAIELFGAEATNFHILVDSINLNNPFDIRRVNDQMMLIDRMFLDPASLPGRSQIYRHLIHSTPVNSPFTQASFPGLKDAIYNLEKDTSNPDLVRGLQQHFSVLVYTIQAAAYSLKDSTSFFREQL